MNDLKKEINKFYNEYRDELGGVVKKASRYEFFERGYGYGLHDASDLFVAKLEAQLRIAVNALGYIEREISEDMISPHMVRQVEVCAKQALEQIKKGEA